MITIKYKVNVDTMTVVETINANVGDIIEFERTIVPETDGQPPRISWGFAGSLMIQPKDLVGGSPDDGTIIMKCPKAGSLQVYSDYNDVRTYYNLIIT